MYYSDSRKSDSSYWQHPGKIHIVGGEKGKHYQEDAHTIFSMNWTPALNNRAYD